MSLPFTYPKTPPPWLALWPARKEVYNLFAEGIRSYAYRVLQNDPIGSITWSEERLTMRVGGQRPVWRLANGTWRRSCSCGYKNDCCAHVYAAARIFDQILNEENWLTRGGKAPPADRKRPTLPRTPLAAEPAREQEFELLAAPRAVSSDQRHRLEVEADFHHEPGMIALRFYVFADDRRNLLRLQQLHNLGMRARHSQQAELMWSEADRRFLCWLSGRLKDTPALRSNLAVLKMTEAQFETWHDLWQDDPGRFIERSSQKALGRSAGALMHVELENDGDHVRIGLVVTAPSGKRLHYHQIFKLLAAGRRQLLLDGAMLDLNPPFSEDLLTEVFSRKTPRMRREHVCDHLADLLEGRLDLVAGPAVEHRQTQADCCIAVLPDGADVLVKPTLGGAPIRLDSPAPAGAISQTGEKFLITRFESPDLLDTRAFLKKLPLQPSTDDTFRVRGDPAAMALLVQAWRELPDSVTRDVAPGLVSLFGPPCDLEARLGASDGGRFADIRLSWAAGDAALGDADVRDAIRRQLGVLRTRAGSWLAIDAERLQQQRATLAEMGFPDTDQQRLLKPDAARLLRQAATDAAIGLSDREGVGARLAAETPPEPPPVSPKLAGVLRHYQKAGVTFLSDRCVWKLGAILADDMGLGKTLQVLAVIEAFLRQGDRAGDSKGALVVCPASVVSVWLDEAAKFCPGLTCRAYAGTPAARCEILQADDWDVLVTNYALVRNDVEAFVNYQFAFLILDEAQQIKNPDAQVTQAIRQLRTPQPIALTGTPIENRLLDLWSIMDVLNPGFLGDRAQFVETYETPGARSELARRIAPALLRRTKEMVAPELPPRTEETLKVELTESQQHFYDRELLRARQVVAQKGPVEVLAALTRLRQICCHPQLLTHDHGDQESAKLDTLLDMLDEILGEGHSALVFSQFTSMLDIIQEALDTRALPYFKLTGSTPTGQRADLVRRFSETDEAAVFLLSLRAAGTGLTLTKADYVFVYDPWWNPAVERQAIDRTHRIGQDKPVIAYRLVAAGTVEEKVLALQAEKAELFADVMGDAERQAVPQRLTAADLKVLLA